MVDSWHPPSDDKELAVFFEDDIEPSPYFFDYLLITLHGHLANADQLAWKRQVIGISLLSVRMNEVVNRAAWTVQSQLPDGQYHTPLFYFQLPCSWGALYFPWGWRQFQKFYESRIAAKEVPLITVTGSQTNKWQRSWKKYLVELMVAKGLLMIYPNLPMQMGFSTHWKEQGEHTKREGKAEEPKVDELSDYIFDSNTLPLVINQSTFDEHFFAFLPDYSKWHSLPALNYLHQICKNVTTVTDAARQLQSQGLQTFEIIRRAGVTEGVLDENYCLLRTFMHAIHQIAKDIPDALQRQEPELVVNIDPEEPLYVAIEIMTKAYTVATNLKRCIRIVSTSAATDIIRILEFIDENQVNLCKGPVITSLKKGPEELQDTLEASMLPSNLTIDSDFIGTHLSRCPAKQIFLNSPQHLRIEASKIFSSWMREKYRKEYEMLSSLVASADGADYVCLLHSYYLKYSPCGSLGAVKGDIKELTKKGLYIKTIFALIEPGSKMCSIPDYSKDNLVISTPPARDPTISEGIYEEWENAICSQASLIVIHSDSNRFKIIKGRTRPGSITHFLP